MGDVSNIEIACYFWACPNQRESMWVPLCREHLLDAWRYVETHPHLQPEMRPKPQQPPPRRQREPAAGIVYYIRRPNGRIKIGTSANLKERALTLNAAWPMDVLAAEWGNREREQERHAEFATDRRYSGASSTEEFVATPEVMAHVASVRIEHGDPVALWDEQIRLNRERGYMPATYPRRADV